MNYNCIVIHNEIIKNRQSSRRVLFVLVFTILIVLVGILIFHNAIKLVKEAVDILIEAVPSHININDIVNDIKSGVANI